MQKVCTYDAMNNAVKLTYDYLYTLISYKLTHLCLENKTLLLPCLVLANTVQAHLHFNTACSLFACIVVL